MRYNSFFGAIKLDYYYLHRYHQEARDRGLHACRSYSQHWGMTWSSSMSFWLCFFSNTSESPHRIIYIILNLEFDQRKDSIRSTAVQFLYQHRAWTLFLIPYTEALCCIIFPSAYQHTKPSLVPTLLTITEPNFTTQAQISLYVKGGLAEQKDGSGPWPRLSRKSMEFSFILPWRVTV